VSITQEEFIMSTHPIATYRIESRHPLLGHLLPGSAFRRLFADRSLAVALAVKSVDDPTLQKVRVVHVTTGEIVFETGPAPLK
jgi:hypothetical protein